MIIWSGLGFLVAVITFGVCLLMNFILDAQFGKGYYSSHPWAVGVALAVGGAISAIIGFFLRTRSGREVIDVETGERMIIDRSQHSLFFIPMHWAGLVITLIGTAKVVYDVIT